MNEQYVEDSYPLSPLQQGMLFHDLYAPHSGLYLQQLVCTFPEELNVIAFKEAWQRVIARHPVLRTSFHWEGLNEPLQRVQKHFNLRWVEEDCRAIPLSEQNHRLETYLQNDRQQGFKLTEAPLTRLALFQMGDADYRFIWTSHHAIKDGRSRFILLNEVFSFYEAFCRGKDLKLKHPRPYRDYIDWLTKEDFNKAEDFWRHMLEGVNTHTPVVVDSISHSTSDQTSEEYEKQETRLSDNLTGALQSVAKQHGLTPNTIFQGAWALLWSRYSGEQDVVFGASRGCRRSGIQGAESMVGLFINTLPVRISVTPNTHLLPWLKELRSKWIAMRDYEHTPIIEIQKWNDIPAGTPLFESILSFENYDLTSAMQAQGGEWINREFESITFTNYPIAVYGYLGSELLIEIVYNRRRFEDRTITRMLGHIEILLESIIANPEQRLSDVRMLTDQEQHQLLVDWNDTQIDYPKDQCIQELFEGQVEKTPDSIAVVFEEAAVTYRELNRRANQLAHHLQGLGVGPDVLVGICVKRSLEMVVALLGVLKAGGAYVPLDPMFPTERLALMLEDAQVAVLLTQKDLVSTLPETHGTVICMDQEWQIVASQQIEGDPFNEANAEHLAYVIYTSGSTGKPKGVQISHRALVNFLYSMIKEPGLTDQDVLLAVTTLSFDIAMLELLLPLIVGARVVIASSQEALDGNRLLNRLTDCGATVMQATPVSWRLLLAVGWQGDDHLKILCGGEALPRDLATQLLQRSDSLWNMYGPTETTIWSTVTKLDDQEGPVLIGFPIANTQIYILDEHLQPVPVGIPGELHIGGDGLARGYLNRPELTAERFIANPFGDMPGSRIYKTGDLARYLPDGNIEVLGRLDFQVKIRGFRIELGEIESVLAQHVTVREAVVLAIEDKPLDKLLVAYVVADRDKIDESSELRKFLKQKLPDYMVPQAYVFLDALPLTPNGKVNHQALSKHDFKRSTRENELVAPKTATEKFIVGIWRKLLGVNEIGIYDNFFELGGHSLLATRVISHVRDTFQVELPVHCFFDAPTVAGLTEVLENYETVPGRVSAIAQILEKIDAMDAEEIRKILHDKRERRSL